MTSWSRVQHASCRQNLGAVCSCLGLSWPLPLRSWFFSAVCWEQCWWWATTAAQASPSVAQDSCLLPAPSATGTVVEHARDLTKELLGDHYGSPTVKEQELFSMGSLKVEEKPFRKSAAVVGIFIKSWYGCL